MIEPPPSRDPAPGQPGAEPRWTSSAKDGVATVRSRCNHLWYAHRQGIVNEVYFPRIDRACVRDFQFLVTDGASFFSEEKRDTATAVETVAPGVPLYVLTNRCRDGRYAIRKEILCDPGRDSLVLRVGFTPLVPGLMLHALLAPHLGNHGAGNDAWVGDYKGTGMLFAQRDGEALALASSVGWTGRSAGFVGASDGWQDLHESKRMTRFHDLAANGNVALTGGIPISLPDGSSADPLVFTLALGFGHSASEAGFVARASLDEDFDELARQFREEWSEWQDGLRDLELDAPLYRCSTAVLATHEDKDFGGTIASLSIPWGGSKGDNDLGGYHLVWPRDLAETGGACLACGAFGEARRILDYLRTTQEEDGHWSQNLWLDGTPYWTGIQLDETALPILLADLASREGALPEAERSRYWPMIRRAAEFIAARGPVTAEDRWEEDAGCSPFTLSAEIAALVAAAGFATEHDEPDDRERRARWLANADRWFENIDRWTYATGTDTARELGVDGYYVRIAPPEVSEAGSPLGGFVAIKNRPPAEACGKAVEIVSPDALALVRFGLRRADDPRILNTVRVVDALLKRELPAGPAWCRYNGDGYGEHEDGSPFDGTGRGRPWPLLTGERAHYELARGKSAEARRLMTAIEGFAGPGGLIPEQVWDEDDVPQRGLVRGRPSGSAMPLVWAHAEYLKLARSLQDGSVFDLPPQTVARYLEDQSQTAEPTGHRPRRKRSGNRRKNA